MENLEKQMGNLFNHFFREEAGNRLSTFAFGTFKEIALKMIRDYKTKEEKK